MPFLIDQIPIGVFADTNGEASVAFTCNGYLQTITFVGSDGAATMPDCDLTILDHDQVDVLSGSGVGTVIGTSGAVLTSQTFGVLLLKGEYTLHVDAASGEATTVKLHIATETGAQGVSRPGLVAS